MRVQGSQIAPMQIVANHFKNYVRDTNENYKAERIASQRLNEENHPYASARGRLDRNVIGHHAGEVDVNDKCPLGGMMDSYTQAVPAKRRYLALEEKRRIVEEALVDGASVARIAQAHGLNANLVFNWRQLHQKGLLTDRRAAKLLPVRVSREGSPAVVTPWGTACEPRSSSTGTIHIQLQKAQVRVEGVVEEGLVRVVLECLRR